MLLGHKQQQTNLIKSILIGLTASPNILLVKNTMSLNRSFRPILHLAPILDFFNDYMHCLLSLEIHKCRSYMQLCIITLDRPR